MTRMRASLSVFGIAALLAIAVACGGEKADEPAAADTAELPLAPATGVEPDAFAEQVMAAASQ